MRSLSAMLGWGAGGGPALAGVGYEAPPPKVLLRVERSAGASLRGRIRFDRPAPRKLEFALAAAVLLGAALLGVARGGQLEAVTAQYGSVSDWVARTLGLGVQVVTVSGITHLSEHKILALAGVDAKGSLPFFDAAEARTRLESDPLIQHASVSKLYPNRILISIVERTPYAVWQKDGEVRAIAADGAAIADVTDDRFADLPFVVGDGAGERVREFAALLDRLEEIRPRVAAGVLINQRRWNLRLKSGLDVKLPETDPGSAISELLALQRKSRILDKDVLALDFRVPGRVFARLSEEGAAAWADAHPVKKGAQP